MILNNYGMLVEGCWKVIPSQYEQVVPDAFVIMPNHVHGIISIVGARFIAPMFDQTNQGAMNQGAMNQGAMNQGAMNRAPTVGEMIRGFKARCTCLINKKRENQGCPVWQRNYYERVIRNDNELNHAREYIINNPLKWNDDDYNPAT
jgi:REP element-mobilizing transposase RayT